MRWLFGGDGDVTRVSELLSIVSSNGALTEQNSSEMRSYSLHYNRLYVIDGIQHTLRTIFSVYI